MNKDGLTDRGAAAVVELVDSGELLALANYPTYDLSTYRQDYAELLDCLLYTSGLWTPATTL